MDLQVALMESWDRQARIVEAVATRVTESNRKSTPSDDGWPLDHQLAHIHKVRSYFLQQIAPDQDLKLAETFKNGWENPIEDLNLIKRSLGESAQWVRDVVTRSLVEEVPLPGYDHPVLFLQHMIWHEGWHVGLIFLALRRAGEEIPEEWEESQVWGEWRTENF